MHHHHQTQNPSRQEAAAKFNAPPSSPPSGTETDPVFVASEAALLVPGDKAKLESALQPGGNVSALANDVGFLTAETDPAFAASEAALIVPGDKAKLDTALQIETDPVFAASEAALLVPGDKAKLDAALQAETDPVFAASEAALLVAGDKAKLDAALQTEADPVFAASEAALLVPGDKAKLDQAIVSSGTGPIDLTNFRLKSIAQQNMFCWSGIPDGTTYLYFDDPNGLVIVRAILKAVGEVRLVGLPTADPLQDGSVWVDWNNGGVLKMSAGSPP